ncbi:MAG: winged helix-turn-helix domain-containing protein [Casimicrobiaceae bacterium]
MRTLLLEDDLDLAQALARLLGRHGFAADVFARCAEAQVALETQRFDLIILDLGLPDGDGLRVLETLRTRPAHVQGALGTAPDVPALILSARDAVDHRVVALDRGADDYLVKPFSPDELLARLRVLRRRAAGRSEPILRVGALSLDPSRRRVLLGEQSVELSAREFDLLHILMEAQGRVLTKEQLEDRLYSWERPVESNTIEVYIHNLRKKLGSRCIRTLRGVGYVIDEPSAGPSE